MSDQIKTLWDAKAPSYRAMQALNAMVAEAQSVLTQYLVPDGHTANEAIALLLGIFDGPAQRRTDRFVKAAEIHAAHYHVAHYEDGKLTDSCDVCGGDLRSEIHSSKRLETKRRADAVKHSIEAMATGRHP